MPFINVWLEEPARPGSTPSSENSAFSGRGVPGRHLVQTGVRGQGPWGFCRRNKTGSLVINWASTPGSDFIALFDLSTPGKLHNVLKVSVG